MSSIDIPMAFVDPSARIGGEAAIARAFELKARLEKALF